jgi:hypothetical protein
MLGGIIMPISTLPSFTALVVPSSFVTFSDCGIANRGSTRLRHLAATHQRFVSRRILD